ncbi:MAG: hypothetical protein UU42_C0006G0046 [Candidatus Woesebacteria bacterium GW2011_GWA1_41_13b]|uniref:50S ribosomal protein L29 n=1 Tax=Candidatus Woesebacteria bacterium GW2011_GWA1_41_13b TaxID=1618555 RepID=A0A0G0XVN4_9BACT|nr:MAG: hypothetical protein UU42_C0006G0046 [Candidatus Woesebacteria bacterium GW2011_GWA1_41_13b]
MIKFKSQIKNLTKAELAVKIVDLQKLLDMARLKNQRTYVLRKQLAIVKTALV